MLGFSTNENLQALPDEEILLRSKREPWHFAILLDRYQEPFMRKALSIIKNNEDAEEIVQDTFTKIYIHSESFTPQEGAKFSSWAYRILFNTSFTYYQKRLKAGQRFSALDPDFEQFVGERKEHSGFEERRDGVERILARLPKHFAQVLRLHYLEHWSQEDIASETGENVGTIKARIHRAKAAFKKVSHKDEAEALM